MRKVVRAAAAALFLHTVAVAAGPEVYSNCFEIVAGKCPTLVFTEDRDVQIKIESYATSAHGWWTVSDASITGNIVFASCEVGSRIVTAKFGSGGNHFSKDFSPREDPIFRVAFKWECRVPSCSSGFYAGWVSLIVNSDNEPVVYGCEVSRSISEPVMGRGEPAHLYAEVEFKTIDHGDWLELDRECIPCNTERWILIPSEINGKPVRSIGDEAFQNCSKITGITIPDGILDIGDRAFSGCSSMKELVIPSSVTNVGTAVTSSCDALTDLRIDAVLPTFGYKAFSHSGVTNIVLAVGITNIDNYAFADNTNLVSVRIPQSVQRIGIRSFNENCENLATAYVPYATVIEDEAFPPGCTIIRYGPNIDAYFSASSLVKKMDEETKIALMRTLNWKDYESAETLYFAGWPKEESSDNPEPPTAAVVCAHLGISPREIEDWDGEGQHKGVYYKIPSVVMTGIDPVARTITGRVIPAAGTRIVSEPFRRAFGFKQFYSSDEAGKIYEGGDYGVWMYNNPQYFTLDFSDYVPEGIFRITYPELEPKGVMLFRFYLQDYAQHYW